MAAAAEHAGAQRVVVVTGAAGWLGQAVAAVFREQGARLVLLDRDGERLQRLYGDWGAQHLMQATDLLDTESVHAAIADATTRLGPIGVLCNIAGGFEMGTPVHETPAERWSRLFALNCQTLLNACAAVVPGMVRQGSGSIVNVGALAALKAPALMGAYAASKSAVIRLTESMAAELGPQGIRVNCVLPSTLDTPDNRRAMPDTDPARFVPTAELAQVIAFLCSPAARQIHGVALPVGGPG